MFHIFREFEKEDDEETTTEFHNLSEIKRHGSASVPSKRAADWHDY